MTSQPFQENLFADELTSLPGGFPCQPFSQAGHRLGARDERSLWSEMLRVIKEVRPTWIVGENVAGIVKMELDNLLADLEANGYAAQTFIIPACGIGAEHRRDRLWIVGNSSSRGFLPKSVHAPASVGFDVSRGNKVISADSLFEIWNGSDAGHNGNGNGVSAELDKPSRIGKDERYNPQTDDEFRLKALGNSIVPGVAFEIFKAIAEVENKA